MEGTSIYVEHKTHLNLGDRYSLNCKNLNDFSDVGQVHSSVNIEMYYSKRNYNYR